MILTDTISYPMAVSKQTGDGQLHCARTVTVINGAGGILGSGALGETLRQQNIASLFGTVRSVCPDK